MASFQNSQLEKIEVNSQASATGAIASEDIRTENTSLDSTVSDNEQDPSGQTIFTVSRLEGEIELADQDFLYVGTLDSGNTVEDEMNARNKVYVRLTLSGNTKIVDSSGSEWLEVRPVVEQNYNPTTDDALVGSSLRFTHPDSGGTQRPA
jgi:GH15 family glucan-1,4-alpha-glucosidase